MNTPIGEGFPVDIGTHGWSGAWAPGNGKAVFNKTFSVGCFEWVPSTRKGMAKKGKVKVRVCGRQHNPEPVYEAAERICRELDAGTYAGPKSIRVS